MNEATPVAGYKSVDIRKMIEFRKFSFCGDVIYYLRSIDHQARNVNPTCLFSVNEHLLERVQIFEMRHCTTGREQYYLVGGVGGGFATGQIGLKIVLSVVYRDGHKLVCYQQVVNLLSTTNC